MVSHPSTSAPASRETLYAIIGSFVLSLVLASFLAGSPFRSLGLAYHDYSRETTVAAQGAAYRASKQEGETAVPAPAPAPAAAHK